MMQLPRLLGGFMFGVWLILGALCFAFSADANPGYGTVRGQILPFLAYCFWLLSAISFLAVLVQYFYEKKNDTRGRD